MAANDESNLGDKGSSSGAKVEPLTKEKQGARREIPGNLPYTTTPGKFKEILDAVIMAERPPKFSGDFMESVLGFSGGSARSIPPILKRMGYLTSDGTPTDLYAKFKSDSARSGAALQGLKAAFSEIFRKNEYAHRANEGSVKDIIVEITGLNKSDAVVRAIYGTFDALRSYVNANEVLPKGDEGRNEDVDESEEKDTSRRTGGAGPKSLGLTYNINIVLPETTNVQVFNAIFESVKRNLLRGDDE